MYLSDPAFARARMSKVDQILIGATVKVDQEVTLSRIFSVCGFTPAILSLGQTSFISARKARDLVRRE